MITNILHAIFGTILFLNVILFICLGVGSYTVDSKKCTSGKPFTIGDKLYFCTEIKLIED